MNEVFTIREGEWQVSIDGVVPPAVWNSRGAAEAGLQVEVRRIEKRARALYEAGTSPRPAWDQLGDVTKSVWRGYVLAGRKP